MILINIILYKLICCNRYSVIYVFEIKIQPIMNRLKCLVCGLIFMLVIYRDIQFYDHNLEIIILQIGAIILNRSVEHSNL